jgi:hypothetical protein
MRIIEIKCTCSCGKSWHGNVFASCAKQLRREWKSRHSGRNCISKVSFCGEEKKNPDKVYLEIPPRELAVQKLTQLEFAW